MTEEAKLETKYYPQCARCRRPIESEGDFGRISWAGTKYEGSDMPTVIHGECPEPRVRPTVWSR